MAIAISDVTFNFVLKLVLKFKLASSIPRIKSNLNSTPIISRTRVVPLVLFTNVVHSTPDDLLFNCCNCFTPTIYPYINQYYL